MTTAHLAAAWGASKLGGDVDEFDAGGGFGNRLPVGLEPFDVELDGLLDEPHDFLSRGACGDAAGQIGHVGAEPGFARFDDYGVTHRLRLVA